jgi:hypothetical protein
VSAQHITCPKCGHVRAPADTAPAWQCPVCGIAYNKFLADTPDGRTTEKDTRPAAQDLREQALPTGRKDISGYTAVKIYVALLGFGIVASLGTDGTYWRWVLPVLAGSAFLFWLMAYRRLRLVEDVPTSAIASAAQGYVELQGTAEPASGHALTGRLTHVPCVWCQYVITARGSDGKVHEVEAGTRSVPFVIRDRTGECLIDHDDAEVVCDRAQGWRSGDVTYKEWSIRIGDPIYAIGHFSTGDAVADDHLNMKVAYVLASEEKNPEAYRSRYDVNADGKVDHAELAAARDAARREAIRRHMAQGGVHVLGKPPDGRPFIIMSAGQEKVAGRYRLYTAAHLVVFLISLGFLVSKLI